MSWEQEQERFILEARLLASSPETVFEELKKLSAKIREEPSSYSFGDQHEISLVGRNERLVNLGLAAYGINIEVQKALYKHGLEPAQDDSDAKYKEGLRVGCLSNNTAPHRYLLEHRYLEDIIGPEEIRRIVNHADNRELSAFIQNPKLSGAILVALYSREGPFAQVEEERWLYVIKLSASNARLVTEYELYDSPDVDYYSIHRAIFKLLEKAPINDFSLRMLYHLLDNLDFHQVRSPERIDHVLARWAQLEAPKEDDRFDSDNFTTTLSIRDQFRCLIAALYGSSFKGGQTVVFGDRDADDVALRCAYYGNGDLTPEDMEIGYRRDKSAFVFAATLNEDVHRDRELRKIMEKEYLRGDDNQRWYRWLKYDDQVRKRWGIETAPQAPDAIHLSIRELQKALAALALRVSELRQLMILVAIILAILIYFRAR